MRTCMNVHVLLLFLWLIPLSVLADAPTHFIDDDFTELERFKSAYFIDKSEEMPFEQVKDQIFTESENAISLGANANVSWIKINISNASAEPKTVFLHNPYAYHYLLIELFEMVDGKIVQTRLLDMDDISTQEWLYQGSSVFDINLAPYQQKTLFIKNVSLSHQWLQYNFYNEDLSKRALLNQFTIISIAVGMLLALIVYNFLLFFSSRLKEHLFYACYLICGGIWIAFTYGLLSSLFNIHGEAAISWHLSLIAMPIFLILFMIYILETNKKYPIEHKALMLVLALLCLEFIHGIFNIESALNYAAYLAAVMMFISLSVSISLAFKRQTIGILFFLGHGLFVLFSSFAVAFYLGKASFDYINVYGVGIGITLEALVLSLIIAYRVRLLERLQIEQADLRLLASTDSLSRLYNRRAFIEIANKKLKTIKRKNGVAAIAILDIDHFKAVNDTYGHICGDGAIRYIAHVLKAESNKEDVVARYGGEEFVIFMPNTSIDKACLLVERIRNKLNEEQFNIDLTTNISLPASIGVAEITSSTKDLKAAVEEADQALYQAKNNGRNQCQVYTP